MPFSCTIRSWPTLLSLSLTDANKLALSIRSTILIALPIMHRSHTLFQTCCTFPISSSSSLWSLHPIGALHLLASCIYKPKYVVASWCSVWVADLHPQSAWWMVRFQKDVCFFCWSFSLHNTTMCLLFPLFFLYRFFWLIYNFF